MGLRSDHGPGLTASFKCGPLARDGTSRVDLFVGVSLIVLATLGTSAPARGACMPSLQTISGPARARS